MHSAPKILVTEAYSAANIGDAELVLRTLEVCRRRWPNGEIRLHAVDPDSFVELVGAPVRTRLFSRLDYLRSDRRRRLIMAATWVMTVVTLSVLTLFPQNRATRRICSLLFGDEVGDYLWADQVIAVGGGYLGDAYMKETLLTAWKWWWATRMGKQVSTMPISIELAPGPLRLIFTRLTHGVTIRVRDGNSLRVLADSKARAELLPDLAFLNARSSRSTTSHNQLGVALVGSDYLDKRQSTTLRKAIALAASRYFGGCEVSLIVMHSPVEGTVLGGDAKAADEMRNTLSEHGIRARVRYASSYGEVCDVVAGCDFLISARMHAGIAGLCMNVPTVLLAYEEKHTSLMDDIGGEGLSAAITADAATIDELVQAGLKTNWEPIFGLVSQRKQILERQLIHGESPL